LHNNTELKTLTIPYNLELIKKTNTKILELSNIVKEEKYSDNSVIDKIKEVNNNLYQINTLPHGFLKEHRKALRKWRDEIEERQKPFKLYIDEMKTVTNIKADEEDIDEKIDLITKFIEKLDSKEFNDAFNDAFKFDLQKVIMLQSQWLFIKFSWERKGIHFFTDFIFRFRFLLLKFLAGFISFLITTFVVFILGIAFKQYSDFLISLIIFVISFFTLDKLIVKKSGKIFWPIVRNQTLILYRQLNNYLNHIVVIKQFMKTEKKS